MSYINNYLDNFVGTGKKSIAGVIKALADDEELDSFSKSPMFTHLFTPEEVIDIKPKEIYKWKQKFKKGEGLISAAPREKEYVVDGFGCWGEGKDYVSVGCDRT